MTAELYENRDYLGEISGAFSDMAGKIPTFERSLDQYFDAHFAAIIDEWGLLTENDLEDFDGRLAALSGEIDRLYGAQVSFEAQAKALDAEIALLEAGHGH